jgi:hypothetical protein
MNPYGEQEKWQAGSRLFRSIMQPEISFRFHHLRNRRTNLVQKPLSNLLSANTFWHGGSERRLQHEVTNTLPASHARSARS